MFEALGRVVYRQRKLILVLGVLVLAVGGLWGGQVSKHLSAGGYYSTSSESARAADAINTTLGQPSADAIVLFRSDHVTVDDPAFQRSVTESLAAVPTDVVVSAKTFWSTQLPQLVSTDRHATYAVVQLQGSDDKAKEKSYETLRAQLHPDGLSVAYAGTQPLNKEISTQISKDLAKAETLSFPVLLVLLLLIFGGLAAAATPLAIGAFGILGAFTMLRLLTMATSVSVFALNLVTMIGLGLAIDYALFVVSRFREELRRGLDLEQAIARTMATAGRTVAFSGITVAVCLASLLLFPEVFLKSMGYGGVAVVIVDLVGALTVLPALLAVLGHRINALQVPLPWRRRRSGLSAEDHHGAWYRIASSVMGRPVAYAVGVIVLLLALGAPFLNVTFGGYSSKVLPAGAPGRVVTETLARDFPDNSTAPIQVVVEGTGSPDQLASYVQRLERVPGVQAAGVTAQRNDTALVQIGYSGNPVGGASQALVRNVRDVTPPEGSHVLVGGQTAVLVDQLASIRHTLPWMGAFMIVSMLILLFLAFGSFVLPIKAVLVNVLSLGAAFGAITWIFQDGHLASWLGFQPLGYLEASNPILMLAVVFGLSMDYEVFLLSRIREEWDATHDNTRSVALGLQRSGRIITSAALLLVIVIGAFSTSQIVTLKMIGIGMVVALVVDATIVRALLVPATMRLLGRFNWWAPAPMLRWWNRHGFREGGVEVGTAERVLETAQR
jgi:RND superfamily putative drug exporter